MEGTVQEDGGEMEGVVGRDEGRDGKMEELENGMKDNRGCGGGHCWGHLSQGRIHKVLQLGPVRGQPLGGDSPHGPAQS